MTDLVLTDEQARILKEAGGHVRLRSRAGTCIGYASTVPELTLEEISELKRRASSNERRYTTQEVLDHLRQFS